MGYNIKQNDDGSTSLFNEASGVEVLKLDKDGNISLTSATSVDIAAGKLQIAGVAVTATAAELNALDGITASVSELNYLDVTTIGTAEASKAVILDANKDITGIRNITLATGGIIASTSDHLILRSGTTATDLAGKTVRINSLTNIGTANSLIGFQSKPAQGASTAQNVIGCEISPRVNDTFALTGSGSLIGAHVDAYLKGTTGNIAGDVRGAQIELVTDDAGARTISGNVNALRVRAAFSATTITGKFIPFRVEKAESQTNSKNFDALFDLTGQSPDCWSDDPTTELDQPGGTVKGYIKVRVNAADRYIALYEKGNLAD